MEIVNKPWGHFVTLLADATYKVKQLTINTNQKISLQSHKHRDEYWVVVSGEGLFTMEESGIVTQRHLIVGDSCFIKKESKHRVESIDKNGIPLVIIEIQRGEQVEESDIIRFEDAYGRL